MNAATLAMLAAAACCAQPAFEVASIKVAKGDPPMFGKGIRIFPGRFVGTYVTLQQLIVDAYDVEPYQVDGPKWITADLYNVEAKAADGATRDEFRAMLQSLIEGQFKLRFHHETRGLSVYGMVLAKAPLKFPEWKGAPDQDLDPGPRDHLRFRNLKMVAAALSRFVVDKPVIDQTGLKGNYFLDVDTSEYRKEQTHDRSAKQFTQQAILEQLGLKLVPMKLPVEMIVLDGVEKAEGN